MFTHGGNHIQNISHIFIQWRNRLYLEHLTVKASSCHDSVHITDCIQIYNSMSCNSLECLKSLPESTGFICSPDFEDSRLTGHKHCYINWIIHDESNEMSGWSGKLWSIGQTASWPISRQQCLEVLKRIRLTSSLQVFKLCTLHCHIINMLSYSQRICKKDDGYLVG